MKIKNVNKITDHNHLNLFSLKYDDRTGVEKSWIFASRSREPEVMSKKKTINPDAVVIVPFHTDRHQLVIIREFRVPIGTYQYGFPAGLMDPGEGVEQTAIRELYEETGLELVKVLKKSPPIYSSSGMTDESVSMVFAQCRGKASSLWNEASEDITVMFIDQNEARALLETRDLKFDVKTWIILSTFAETGKI